jgi:hypothetical protein
MLTTKPFSTTLLEVLPDMLVGNLMMKDHLTSLHQGTEVARTAICGCKLTLDELLLGNLA